MAMITLELALVHLHRGEPLLVRKLAAEMMPLFRAHELHRHSLATVCLMVQAALEEIGVRGGRG